MKFSIIIPVYNVEKYIDKCLNSILNQTYENFEVIIVNDGTKDNSQNIIDGYVKKDRRFKSFIKENGGLSDARNYGLKYAIGDYLIFIDSDDFISLNLLCNLNQILTSKKYDVVKYMINVVSESGDIIRKELCKKDEEVNFEDMTTFEFSEPAWSYAYNLKFFKKYKFMYEKGKIHEDFGLTPLILALSSSIYVLNYYGYNYVQRSGSIVNGAEKRKKRAYDMLYHFENLTNKIKKYDINPITLKYFNSYMANGVINGARLLENNDLNDYIKKLKDYKVYDLVISNTLLRKIKKIILKYNMKFYIKFM